MRTRRMFGAVGREAEARRQIRAGVIAGGVISAFCAIWLAGALYGGGSGPFWGPAVEWGVTGTAVALLTRGLSRGSQAAALVLLLGYVFRKLLMWSAGVPVWTRMIPVVLLTYGLVQGVRGTRALRALRDEETRMLVRGSEAAG